MIRNLFRIFFSMLVVCVFIVSIRATPTIKELMPNQETIEIPVKKSVIVKLNEIAEQVSVVAPEIADVHIVDPRQLLITAVSVGETSVIVWTAEGKTRMITVLVHWNTLSINKSLSQMLPDDALEAVPIENSVALHGTANSLNSAERALEITRSYVPKVVDMMKVPGEQQVLLKVKIAEVANNFRYEEGFNFLINSDDVVAANKLNNLISGDFAQGGDITMSDAVTTFFSFPKSDVAAFIQALKERGWIHVLAEPNLVSRSGETASFLAGGEFPIPVPQGIGDAITVEYKEFGVRLKFTPTVMDQSTIHLDIAPEVSDLDFSSGVTISGFTVPTIVTRRAHTVVQLHEGQTFAIAGLISQNSQRQNGRIPYVGDIPILGRFFQRKEITEEETELLIMVTPYLVAPLDDGESYRMPSKLDWEHLESAPVEEEGISQARKNDSYDSGEMASPGITPEEGVGISQSLNGDFYDLGDLEPHGITATKE